MIVCGRQWRRSASPHFPRQFLCSLAACYLVYWCLLLAVRSEMHAKVPPRFGIHFSLFCTYSRRPVAQSNAPRPRVMNVVHGQLGCSQKAIARVSHRQSKHKAVCGCEVGGLACEDHVACVWRVRSKGMGTTRCMHDALHFFDGYLELYCWNFGPSCWGCSMGFFVWRASFPPSEDFPMIMPTSPTKNIVNVGRRTVSLFLGGVGGLIV